MAAACKQDVREVERIPAGNGVADKGPGEVVGQVAAYSVVVAEAVVVG